MGGQMDGRSVVVARKEEEGRVLTKATIVRVRGGGPARWRQVRFGDLRRLILQKLERQAGGSKSVILGKRL